MIKFTREQIEAWVASNFRYKRRARGRQLVICNPWDGDTGYHLWISTEEAETPDPRDRTKKIKGYWVHDFRPGKHHDGSNGSIIKFVMEYKNASYYDAISQLCGKDKKDLRSILHQHRNQNRAKEEQTEIQEQLIELPKYSKLIFSDGSGDKTRSIAINYLYGRAITDDVIQRAQIHYTPGSIVFPYIEYGMMVFWQERDILNKRFNFPDSEKTGLLKTDYLYGFDDIEPNSQLIVVESIFNKLSVGDSSVATGGATIAGKQVNKLGALNPSIIILAPDNDEAGIKSLIDNFFLLYKKFRLAYSIPPGDKDWNDMDKVDGKGSAMKYIEKHTYSLNIQKICQFKERVA